MANQVKKYYIFRHGETFVSKGLKTGYGLKVFSADILDEGKPPLEKMGRYLKKIPTDFNASSRFKRCRTTVGIISKNSGKEFIFDSRLNEFFFELPFFFRRRIRHFLRDLNDKNLQTVLICTHAAVINELISMINPQAFATLVKKAPDPTKPLQTEVRKDLPLPPANSQAASHVTSATASDSLPLGNKLTFTKYLAPGVLLILTENSVQEINFNTQK
jgi:phosphohistidine phosphatase SixA